MNTIEMKVGNKSVQFTTKSLIMDGKEFYYHKMSDIKHSASKHVYAFTYDGKQEYLPYDPKYEKGLKVIFGKIHALGKSVAKTDAKAADTAAAPAPEETKAAEAAAKAESVEPAKTPEEETVFDIPAEEAEAKQDASGEAPSETAATEVVDSDPTKGSGSEKVAAGSDSDVPAKEDETAAPATDDTAEGTNVTNTEEAPAEEPEPPIPPEEKKGKLKKSILVLIGILAVIAVLAAIYFATIGTSNNPKAGPNSTESQQYDDIDELIEDLDN